MVRLGVTLEFDLPSPLAKEEGMSNHASLTLNHQRASRLAECPILRPAPRPPATAQFSSLSARNALPQGRDLIIHDRRPF
jgi:hypothetical protein